MFLLIFCLLATHRQDPPEKSELQLMRLTGVPSCSASPSENLRECTARAPARNAHAQTCTQTDKSG